MRGRRRALTIVLVLTLILAWVGVPWSPSRTLAFPARFGPIPNFLRMPAHWTGAALSPQLRRQTALLDRALRHFARPGQSAPTVTVILTSALDLSGAIEALGGRVQTDIRGHVLVATLPADQVQALAETRGALTLDVPRRMTPSLDVAVPEIGANKVWSLTSPSGAPLQGSHVLVGMVDSGIDYRHPDFQNPDGTSRIKFIKDETQGGMECDSASINSGQCPVKDATGHGTHVTGVAAGNGRAENPPKEIGVAPQADIGVVKVETSTDVLAAWQYLVQKAQALNEPLVINTSLGTAVGPHDGTGDLEAAIDLLAGPGRLFVISAGNTGHLREHAQVTVAQGGSASISFDTKSVYPESVPDTVDVDGFFPAGDQITATLTNTDTGESWGPTQTQSPIVADHIPDKGHNDLITLWNTRYNTHWNLLLVEVKQDSGGTFGGHFRLDLQGTEITDSGRFNAWIPEFETGEFTAGVDETDTLLLPGDAADAITVANYDARPIWTGADGKSYGTCGLQDNVALYTCTSKQLEKYGQEAATSSLGPTVDGRQKPDVAAPGENILSAHSRDAQACSASVTFECIPAVFLSPDGKYYSGSGTSDAAPFVTGTLALMLQQDPALDPQQADAILRSTARHDANTGSDPWTPGFGAGKLDAFAAVESVIHNPPPTDTPTPTATATATPVPPAKKTKKCKKGYKLVKGKCKKKK